MADTPSLVRQGTYPLSRQTSRQAPTDHPPILAPQHPHPIRRQPSTTPAPRQAHAHTTYPHPSTTDPPAESVWLKKPSVGCRGSPAPRASSTQAHPSQLWVARCSRQAFCSANQNCVNGVKTIIEEMGRWRRDVAECRGFPAGGATSGLRRTTLHFTGGSPPPSSPRDRVQVTHPPGPVIHATAKEV